LAASAAAYGEGDPPPDLIEAWLCEAYHCLPSQLDREDRLRLQRQTHARRVYDVMRRLKMQGHKGLTAEEQALAGEILRLEAGVSK
jgi:hypothetical protein